MKKVRSLDLPTLLGFLGNLRNSSTPKKPYRKKLSGTEIDIQSNENEATANIFVGLNINLIFNFFYFYLGDRGLPIFRIIYLSGETTTNR